VETLFAEQGFDSCCLPSTENGLRLKERFEFITTVPCWNCKIACGQSGVVAALPLAFPVVTWFFSHTIRNGPVICALVESILCERVRYPRMTGLNETIIDWIVESLCPYVSTSNLQMLTIANSERGYSRHITYRTCQHFGRFRRPSANKLSIYLCGSSIDETCTC
jgi:hypothetical protein